MKTTLLALALAGMTSMSFGQDQGYVAFVNNAASDVYTNNTLDIYGNPSLPIGSGFGLTTPSTVMPHGFYYALFMQPYSGGPTNNPTYANFLSSGWLFTGNFATNALGAGRLGGGNPVQTLMNNPIGSANQFVIVGWSSNVAGSGLDGWLTVSNEWAQNNWMINDGQLAYFGISNVGTGVGRALDDGPETLFSASWGGISTPMTLYVVVPEPSTVALAGLGGLSFLLFRRRK
jgi:hypothetical protein